MSLEKSLGSSTESLLTVDKSLITRVSSRLLYICIYVYMVFTTEGLFEVAIESWSEWDLNPRPLNSVQTL